MLSALRSISRISQSGTSIRHLAQSAGRLAGKVLLVTGGGTGLGRGIAEKFAQEGGHVAVTGLIMKECEEVANAIVKNGGSAIPVHADVTSEQDVEQSFATTLAKWGRVDCVVSNAGIQKIAPIEDFSFKDWRQMMAVHLDGAFLYTRAAMKQMKKQKEGGAIIYIGSVHSKEASLLKAPYVAAKHGIVGLCRAVSKEGGPHKIRANVVCPGFVRTALVEKQIPEQAATLGITEEQVIKNVMLKNTVDGEFTTVNDVAEACLFFAAHDTNAFTGQSLIVSHGWHME